MQYIVPWILSLWSEHDLFFLKAEERVKLFFAIGDNMSVAFDRAELVLNPEHSFWKRTNNIGCL